MELFEKEQRIDAIKGIIKARFVNIFILIALGFILEIKYFGGFAPSLDYLKTSILGAVVLGYNFAYWLFIHRPIEKIGNRSLAIISACQVVVDQIIYTLIFYFAGTVETMAFILYYLTILIASSIYKTKGIILAALLAVILHNGLLFAEYYKIIPHLTAYEGTVWFGNPFITRGKIFGFVFYTGAAVVFSAVLSGLFRKRERALREQKDQLSVKTQSLTGLTKELEGSKTSLEIKVKERTQQLKTLMESLEGKVKERTKELQLKIDELEKFQRLTIGREVAMVELKKEIKKIKEELKKNKPST
jgi:hypothetical protein